MNIKIDDQISQQVRELARLSDTFRAKSEDASLEAQNFQEQARAIEATFGLRERYLRGYLGGDRDAVKAQIVAHYEGIAAQALARAHGRTQEKTQGQITDILSSYLSNTDQSYTTLKVPLNAVILLSLRVDQFKAKIKTALKEIDEAQSMETMDLFTKNAAISIMSSIENGQARDAIEDVKKAAPAFQKAIEDYNGAIKQVDLGALDLDIDDFTDLVFDLVLDGFDFMSIFTLNALGDAEEQMRAAMEKVDEVSREVEAIEGKAQGAVDTYIRHVQNSLTM